MKLSIVEKAHNESLGIASVIYQLRTVSPINYFLTVVANVQQLRGADWDYIFLYTELCSVRTKSILSYKIMLFILVL